MKAVAIACAIAAAACGDDGDATPQPIDGAPAATRALLPDKDPIVIGGDSAFGLAKLQRYKSGAWTAAAVTPFGSQAQLFAGIAATDTTLYRLTDAAAFAWSAEAIPAASTAIALVGARGDTIYATALDPDGGALVAWTTPLQLWLEVPGTRPLGAAPAAFLIEDARITWSDPARGIVRAEAGAQTVVVDCQAEDNGACATPLVPLYYTGDDLALIACARGAPPIAAFRLHDTDLQPIGLPADVAACASVASRGTQAVMATLPDDGGDGVLYRLDGTAKSWKRIAVASPGLTYVPAGGLVYAYGNGLDARGVYRIDP